ncbi:MAG TPA: NHL repeat-containing protein [Pyrinomonadaceae bacterium]|nr:NHL repeat-containing protein [Pyrinomonadaceae bacterium]
MIDDFSTEKTLWGDPPVARCLLHSPRSVERHGSDYLIADTLNNSVVFARPGGEITPVVSEAKGVPLFWPRFATRVDDTLYVSDSRNGRVLTLSDGETPRSLGFTLAGKVVSVSDPHSIRPAGGGLLLICDTGQNRLLLIDRAGAILKAWSGQEDDWPSMARIDVEDLHDADLDAHRHLWLADTGRGRLVCLDTDDRPVREIISLRSPGGRDMSPLKSPRSIQAVSDDLLLVCDSGNHRVLLLDHHGSVRGIYGGERGLAHRHLSYPRFARLSGGRLLIADFSNNRILDLPRSHMSSPDGEGHD